MNGHSWQLLEVEKNAYLKEQAPTLKNYRDARQIEERTEAEIKSTEGDLTAAEGRCDTFRSEDRRAISVSLIWEFVLLALLALGEMFVNYLAAEGLLQDQRTTLGVTAFLTVIVALIAFGVAWEDRHRRRDAHAGHFPPMSWTHKGLLAGAGIYLVGSFFLRERYFASEKGVATLIGSFAANPWLVATALTALAGVGIAATVYVLSHIDHEHAAAKRQRRALHKKLPALQHAHDSAAARRGAAEHDLDVAAHRHQSSLSARILGEPGLPDDGADHAADAGIVLGYLQNSWRQSTTGPGSTDDRSSDVRARAVAEEEARKHTREPQPPPAGS